MIEIKDKNNAFETTVQIKIPNRPPVETADIGTLDFGQEESDQPKDQSLTLDFHDNKLSYGTRVTIHRAMLLGTVEYNAQLDQLIKERNFKIISLDLSVSTDNAQFLPNWNKPPSRAEYEESRTYAAAGMLSSRPFVGNRFPIVNVQNKTTSMGAVLRTTVPLKNAEGQIFNYVAITLSTSRLFYVAFTSQDDQTYEDNLRGVLAMASNRLITLQPGQKPLFLTICSTEPFIEHSFVACALITLMGYTTPALITGAVLDSKDFYTPNGTNVKDDYARKNKLPLLILADAADVQPGTTWDINYNYCLSGVFLENGRPISPIVATSLGTVWSYMFTNTPFTTAQTLAIDGYKDQKSRPPTKMLVQRGLTSATDGGPADADEKRELLAIISTGLDKYPRATNADKDTLKRWEAKIDDQIHPLLSSQAISMRNKLEHLLAAMEKYQKKVDSLPAGDPGAVSAPVVPLITEEEKWEHDEHGVRTRMKSQSQINKLKAERRRLRKGFQTMMKPGLQAQPSQAPSVARGDAFRGIGSYIPKLKLKEGEVEADVGI